MTVITELIIKSVGYYGTYGGFSKKKECYDYRFYADNGGWKDSNRLAPRIVNSILVIMVSVECNNHCSKLQES